MQRLSVRYRPEAIADLEDIYKHIYRLSFSPQTAQGLMSRCSRIGDAPRGGRARNDLAVGLRTVPFEGKAVIVYRIEADGVRIVNIFYGGRDFEALYKGPPPDESDQHST